MKKMKIPKVMKIVLLSLGVLAILSAGTVYASYTVAKNNSIDEKTAKEFAYVDAGLTEEEVEFSSAEFEFDDGVYVYDVEFNTKDAHYEYTVKASDGLILEKEMELLQKPQTKNQTETQEQEKEDTTVTEQTKQQKTKKSKKQQKDENQNNAVTEKAGSENITKQGEGQNEQKKPGTDKALKKKSENAANTTRYISVDKAKAIALSHAGVGKSSVTFAKAKLESEDGRMVYEVEFYVGSTEYEYGIDATTGNIVEVSKEVQSKVRKSGNKKTDDDDDDDDDEEEDD